MSVCYLLVKAFNDWPYIHFAQNMLVPTQMNKLWKAHSHVFFLITTIVYISGSQTVRRDAPVRRFNFPRASRDNLVLCH